MYQAILFLPLFGFLLCGALGCGLKWEGARFIPTGLMLICAVLAAIGFWQIEQSATLSIPLFTFIDVGALSVEWGLYVDSLTRVMTLVVCWISALVHIYSLGYMAEDPSRPRFFAYLSLFTFTMLALVMAPNFIQLFFGWEGVGLASYLLIGFWFEKDSANAASIKAFVVNRVGDMGLILAIAFILATFHTSDFSTFFTQVSHATTPISSSLTIGGVHLSVLDMIGVLLFIGAMGKSAQLFLHVWLPDAMEGPTPVSALIHAATMVTAGVFLLARCSALYELAPIAQTFIIFIGATTTFMAATIALTQTDIKRVIAYSTCSQLGYMFIAMGSGAAYHIGIFHLFTHAFFKALLFLGAGSVILAAHHEQDMRNMGGLWRQLPFTWLVMLVGTLAITGFPFTAGYYSKDAIIEAIYTSSHGLHIYGFALALFSVFLTSFYSWRLMFMTFHGPRHAYDDAHHISHTPQEAPMSMAFPLAFLAILALISGFLARPFFIGTEQTAFWHGIFGHFHHEPDVPSVIPVATMAMMAFGFGLSWIFYIGFPTLPKRLAEGTHQLYTFLTNKWYFDALYERLFLRTAFALGYLGWKIDKGGIDALGPDGATYVVQTGSKRLSLWQTGYIYHYALAMAVGLFILLTYVMGRGHI